MTTTTDVAQTNRNVKVRGVPGAVMLDAASVEEIPWTDSDAMPGLALKYLQVDLSRGFDVSLMKVSPGARIPVHMHWATSTLFCIKGKFAYQPVGMIDAGGYGFEPYGIIHEPDAGSDEEAIVLTINFSGGLVQFYNEDGTLGPISHVGLLLQEMYRKHGEKAVAHLNLPPSFIESIAS
jgi:2,4'-dihydroxyacetophenone dioxygenase